MSSSGGAPGTTGPVGTPAPAETKSDLKVDKTWNRLTHVLFRRMPAQLAQVANARRQVNSLFKSGR